MRNFNLLFAVLFVAANSSAVAATLPTYSTPLGPQAATGVVILDGQGNVVSSAATAAPTALTPTTIATAGTYQQAAAAGKAVMGGGVIQAPAANASSVCVDTTSAAAPGLTTPTGGQVCAAPGQTVSFPATSGAVFVYGTAAGDTFSGSVL